MGGYRSYLISIGRRRACGNCFLEPLACRGLAVLVTLAGACPWIWLVRQAIIRDKARMIEGLGRLSAGARHGPRTMVESSSVCGSGRAGYRLHETRINSSPSS